MTVAEIVWTDDKRSTKIWRVFDRHGGNLGEIRWNGRWRQYVFEPPPTPITLSSGCMSDIALFIVERMREWRKAH